jgi:hypothetical protein
MRTDGTFTDFSKALPEIQIHNPMPYLRAPQPRPVRTTTMAYGLSTRMLQLPTPARAHSTIYSRMEMIHMTNSLALSMPHTTGRLDTRAALRRLSVVAFSASVSMRSA